MADHEFRIESDSPAKDDLMFWRIVGHEALARPAAYELTVLSKNKDLAAKDILGHAFDVVIEFKDADGGAHERHCQGHAVRFVRAGHIGRHYEYRIALRSWFWLLTKRANSRIHQEKKVLEVLDAVFEDSPIKRFKKTKATNVIGTHNPRRYCVQHQESDYQFLSRLLEDEGIYYWFDAHDAPGTMHLSDASDLAHDKLPATDTLRHMAVHAAEPRFNEISRWVSARQFDTGKHSSRDSDFKAIKKKLGADIDSSDQHELAEFEMFEFPGGYFSGDDAETRAKLRGDELNARRDRHWALTPWPDVAAGRSFKFEDDPDGTRNGDYVIAACTFIASHRGYEGVSASAPAQPVQRALAEVLRDDAVNADTLPVLEELIAATPALAAAQTGSSLFLLTVMPVDRPFRAPRLTPRVTMPGPQTAIVVGPKGDELHVDDHGRVKVHFHWDRYDGSNEKSTCWVRVSQPWGGKGWGGYFAPRIGQEVIVDFLNGDPDRPVIVGRVYNDDQPIPYKSPTQSGFRTRSTPGGGVNNYNEIMFEDKKGSENINIHAELDMSRSVERDDSGSVGRDQSLKVDRDQTVSVQRNRTVNVTNNETKSVKVAQKITVGASQDVHVVANQTTNVDGAHALVVKGDHRIETKSARTDFTASNESRTVGGNQTVTIAGSMAHKASRMTFEAGHIEFKVTGGNSMKMDAGVAPFQANFMQYSLVSNTHINLMAIGDINQTSLGSNTTVLGANSSGYIGTNSEANLGAARSTFLGMSMDNAVGLAVANFMGMQIENTIALKLETVASMGIERKLGSLREAPIHIFKAGGGGGGGGGPPPLNRVAALFSAVGAIRGLFLGARDVDATFTQYENAAKQLEEAAKDPDVGRIPGLQKRLQDMAGLARDRKAQGEALAGSHYGTDTAIGAGTGAALGLVTGPFAIIASPVLGVAGAVVGGPIGAMGRAMGSGAEDQADALKPAEDGSVPAPQPPPQPSPAQTAPAGTGEPASSSQPAGPSEPASSSQPAGPTSEPASSSQPAGPSEPVSSNQPPAADGPQSTPGPTSSQDPNSSGGSGTP
ncbi:type VI secretion system tip protein VgrG [Variovorax boronicumulans]|uniref:Type VI secretion system tip protein VgrG n=1 Tax=Variovorax boronicumulans TaxID=436515 RepID=A0A250DD92_9BURK|nr:type VI secretion system tip protein TssI/VgrG [Variovorax boronicumulans]ATA52310.1 type VI secretion system tip protein VgrG [Variovorax boronicumulans]